MAETPVNVVLNIGSQRVSMGVFDITKNKGLVLQKYASTNILVDPKAEKARLDQLGIAITELRDKLGISKGTKISYTISGKSVFTRYIKLPDLDDENLDQVVAFEAQQHVPFPINEVIWDWEELESPENEKEVALVAIKADALNDIDDAVAKTGIITNRVDAAPMALYNAFKYNYPDLEGTSLLIDIGAKTCNLIYADGNRMFTRSIPMGGSSITMSLAKEYGIDFSEAETQKCTNGLVALNTVHTSELDEPTANMGTVIRNALGKLPAEIARTTNYYRSQHDGKPPIRILLAGGGTNLPYIVEFFQEKLRLDVEFFNPLKRIAVSKSVDIEKASKEAHMLGELVGLALLEIDQVAISMDLVPKAVARRRDDQRRRPWLLGAAAILLLALAGWAGFNYYRNSQAQEELSNLQSKIDERNRYFVPMDKIKREERALNLTAEQLSSAQNARTRWVNIWDQLAEYFLSERVWLVDFKPVLLPVSSENSEKISQNAESLIADNFQSQQYGTSAIVKVKDPSTSPQKGHPKKKRDTGPQINAIIVKGFWRGDNGHKEVTKLIDELREKGNYFKLPSTEKIIISLPTSLEENAYVAPFEIILPLAQGMPASLGTHVSNN